MLNVLTINHGFAMALCLAVVCFLMPIFSRELRQSASVAVGYWFVIFLHQIVAFLNAYLFEIGKYGTPGAKLDANRGFHLVASELALHGEIIHRSQELSIPLSLGSFMKGGSFYYEMLGTVYNWFGVSLLLGEQLSILAFAFSCIIFLKIMRQLGIERYTAFSLICFGALPSVVLYGAVTLREPYEALFFMLAVYFGVKFSFEKKISIFFACLIVLSASLMGVFHKALPIYTIFLIILFLVWSPRSISRFGNIKKLHLVAMVVIPLVILGVIFVSKFSFPSSKLMGRLLNHRGIDGLIQVVLDSRQGQMTHQGRASYGALFDSSSLLMVAFSSVKIFIYYLFAPFPWMVKNIMDFYAFLESISRMTLIYFSVKCWRNARGEQRQLLRLMLILFFSMSCLWAMGTTNYGTAMRHNMVAWWIIVIMGAPQLIVTLKLFLSEMKRRYLDSSVKKNTRLKA